jgi:hypothetical protein
MQVTISQESVESGFYSAKQLTTERILVVVSGEYDNNAKHDKSDQTIEAKALSGFDNNTNTDS